MLIDWYDREIDAINEPYRPIPSGEISENEVWNVINYFFYTRMSTRIHVFSDFFFFFWKKETNLLKFLL